MPGAPQRQHKFACTASMRRSASKPSARCPAVAGGDVRRKQAFIQERGKDRYGRTIGGVTCGGLDANTEQVRRGMAWTFKRYVPVNFPLYEMEAYARLRQLGLWADPHSVPPWEWRDARRQEGKRRSPR
jgi:endonuclease YncB( thermonuclease family)